MTDLRPPILVAGAPRSGLTVVSGILRGAGVWFAPPAENVGRGGAPLADENRRIRAEVVRPLFRGLDTDALGVRGIPRSEDLLGIAEKVSETWSRSVLRIVEEDAPGAPWEGLWGYAGPDAAVVWPIWAVAFPGAFWVLVRRDRGEILRSYAGTGSPRAPRGRPEREAWLRAYDRKLDEIREERGVRSVEVWPKRILSGDVAHAREALRAAGLREDEVRSGDAVSRALWPRGIYAAEEA